MTGRYFEELEVGQRFLYSQGRTITEVDKHCQWHFYSEIGSRINRCWFDQWHDPCKPRV